MPLWHSQRGVTPPHVVVMSDVYDGGFHPPVARRRLPLSVLDPVDRSGPFSVS